jgi:hypothetical protein
VSVGIIALLLFYRQELSQLSFQKKQDETTTADDEETE